MGNKLNGRDLIKLGFPNDTAIQKVLGYVGRNRRHEKKEILLAEAKSVLQQPDRFKNDPTWHFLVQNFENSLAQRTYNLLNAPAPFSIFGANEIDALAKNQLYDALRLPIAVSGALMPDAHAGYGLPIGGVLATHNAVIPYGVGVDIGCSMHLTLFNLPGDFAKGREDQMVALLRKHTCFGMNEVHESKGDHVIFNHVAFSEIPILKKLKSKAFLQLGTSGGGNHFVELGSMRLPEGIAENGIPPGDYFALLSHSGSRSLGAHIAQHYTAIAQSLCKLPKQVHHLAWLDLSHSEGQDYWRAMQVAAEYATACHEDIHYRISKALGEKAIFTISNHHNLAWKERYEEREVIVHRKGATPAARNQWGIIPGSMTAPGFLVQGKGNVEALQSASHGAGRLLSRSKCKATLTRHEFLKAIKQKEVRLIGGGIDEAPMAYKDIHKVMALQSDLVDVRGMFQPKIVRMDG